MKSFNFTLMIIRLLKIFIHIAFACFSTTLLAQDDLFGVEKKEAKDGLIISANVSFDLPMASMAERFGASTRVGPSLMYKTKSNLLIGLKADFIFGNQINEPGFLSNIKAQDGSLLSAQGYRTYTTVLERGYLIGFQVGKLFPFDNDHQEHALLALASVGFMQHKILISNRTQDIPQLDGDYVKGYDRLANGIFLEQFVGWNHFTERGFINGCIGLDFLIGFNQGRRDYLFDVMKPGNENRIDILSGIRLQWYIPAFKRRSEDYYFE